MPTWNSVQSQLGNVVKLHEVYRGYSESLLSTYIATITTSMDLDAQSAPAATSMAVTVRGTFANLLNPGGLIRTLMTPYILQLGTLINPPQNVLGNPGLIVSPYLVRYMIDNPDGLNPAPRYQSRQFNDGPAVPGGGNIGGGTVVRCLVTSDGQPVENRFADVINFRCSQDQTLGALPQREGFDVWGRDAIDSLDYYQAGKGTGLSFLYLNGAGTPITAINSDTSANAGVQNTSFGSGGAQTGTAPASWVPTTSAAHFDVVADNANATAALRTVYRIADSESGGACSVKFKTANDKLTQLLTNVTLSNVAPYFLEVAYNAGIGAFNGTLTIGLGTNTASIALTGGAGWHTLRLKIDKNLWLKNFNNGAVAITIAISGFVSGYLLVDDLRFDSFKNAKWNSANGAYDNQWILIVSEAAGATGQVNFAVGDTFTITSTEIGAENQRKFHLGFGATMPCAPPAPGAGLAVALAGAGAGALSNGVYKYWITKVRQVSETDFNESGISAFATVTVANNAANGKTSSTGFPVDADPGIYGYKLYRSQVGGAVGTLVTTILYANIAVPYVDNASDASIAATASPPGGVTIAEP